MEIYYFNPKETYHTHATEGTNFCRVYVWCHKLSTAALRQIAEEQGITLSQQATVGKEKRQTEHMSIEIMLKSILSHSVTLGHQPTGAPFVEMPDSESPHISISHTRNTYVVSIGNKPHGVDAEHHTDKAWRLHKRFLTPPEQSLLNGSFADLSNQEAATALWSAKEAAFKAFSASGYPISNICQIGIACNPDLQLLATLDNSTPKALISIRKLRHCILTLCQFT